jgi:hypothetical protein
MALLHQRLIHTSRTLKMKKLVTSRNRPRRISKKTCARKKPNTVVFSNEKPTGTWKIA